MSLDPWNGHNPEDDPIFQAKVAIHRAQQRPIELAEEERRLHRERAAQLAHTIRISDGTSNGEDEYLCVICCRAFTPGRGKYKWIACVFCLKFDRAAARNLDSKQLIPLGLHSSMNGAFIQTSASPVLQLAQKDRLLASCSNYNKLVNYRTEVMHHMAQSAGWLGRETVPWHTWARKFPSSILRSEVAYLAILQELYPWAYELLPELQQPGWLLKLARKESATQDVSRWQGIT